MLAAATKLGRCVIRSHLMCPCCCFHLRYMSNTLEEAIIGAVESKSYQQIPDLLNSFKEPLQIRNPFLFLSGFSQDIKTQIIDEILQSFIPLRPRSHPHIAYAYLLSYSLQGMNPFPLSLAVLQCTLRSGYVPVPQTRLILSSAWLEQRSKLDPVVDILSQMHSIGYYPDCGTCNYLISSLCAVDQLGEAMNVLKGMSRAGCIPDLEGYGAVIGAMCTFRRASQAAEMMKEMVLKVGLTPAQGTIVKVAAALRANREMWKAVEMIEYMEIEGFSVGFETYELVVEGCLECREFILAAKMVMAMTGRGFIPYIKVRQKVIEGLAGVGEWKLACTVRQRLAELGS